MIAESMFLCYFISVLFSTKGVNMTDPQTHPLVDEFFTALHGCEDSAELQKIVRKIVRTPTIYDEIRVQVVFHYAKAMIEIDQKWEQATLELEAALELDPRRVLRSDILAQLALCKNKLGDPHGAVATGKTALSQMEPNTEKWVRLKTYIDEIEYDIANPELGLIKRLGRFFRRAGHGLAMS